MSRSVHLIVVYTLGEGESSAKCAVASCIQGLRAQSSFVRAVAVSHLVPPVLYAFVLLGSGGILTAAAKIHVGKWQCVVVLSAYPVFRSRAIGSECPVLSCPVRALRLDLHTEPSHLHQSPCSYGRILEGRQG